MLNAISQEARRAVDSLQSIGLLTAVCFELPGAGAGEAGVVPAMQTLIREATERFERVVRRRYV